MVNCDYGPPQAKIEVCEGCMPVTILHISDLHRDPKNPLTNPALLNSLEVDLCRAAEEAAAIPTPDLLVVSGDLVQGVPPDAEHPEARLAEQYDEALAFLVQLADSQLAGNRERVVIVPGNHDVSFPQTVSSLRPINLDHTHPAPLAAHMERLFSPNSTLRWWWQRLALFEVKDLADYHARLGAFSHMYEKFYDGQRRYSLNPNEQVDVFDYPELGLVVVGFNSCHNNDPLSRRAAIHPDCLASGCRLMRERRFNNRLRLAVWHHSTNGGPFDTNYMDPEVLQVLIDGRFSIGFHGHQHKAAILDERYQFGGERKINVVCAGTLCGGPAALPPGHARTFNIVVVDTEALSATVHQRRMQNEDFNNPIWGPGLIPGTRASSADFPVQSQPVDAGQVIAEMAEAEELIRTGHHDEAAHLLRPLFKEHPVARRQLLECIAVTNNAVEIIEKFDPPKSTTELIYLADALWVEGKKDRLRELLESEKVASEADPSVVAIRDKFLARLET